MEKITSDLMRSGEPLFRTVPAFRAPIRSVVWINPSWKCPTPSTGHNQKKSWVVRHFAYRLIGALGEVPAGSFKIDAYGATGIARYGGSGRAGAINGYQIKGIGVTPFVDPDGDWTHSHGGLLLAEAIRETVLSVVAQKLLPHGATESLAVMELRDAIVDENGCAHRSALMLRPFKIRPCHLQRALGFHENLKGRGHISDVDRVKIYTRLLHRSDPDSLPKFARSLGRQIAVMHVIGWFHGGLYSSNICMDGSLIDFGSSRFVPDRSISSYELHGPRFGQEMEFARELILSVAYFWNKYAGRSAESEMLRELDAAYADSIHSVLVKTGRIPPDAPVERYESASMEDTFQQMQNVLGTYSREHLNHRIEAFLQQDGVDIQANTDALAREILAAAEVRGMYE